MKKGNTIEFNFHGFGTVSKETTKVTRATKDFIYVDAGWKFDRKTGKCLNDETSLGCHRTIDKEVE